MDALPRSGYDQKRFVSREEQPKWSRGRDLDGWLTCAIVSAIVAFASPAPDGGIERREPRPVGFTSQSAADARRCVIRAKGYQA